MVASIRQKQRTTAGDSLSTERPGGMVPLRRDDAVAQIRAIIERLALKHGDRLPSERQLADNFGLSRGTVREALQFLAALNLVEIRHGGGCFIRTTPDEIGGLRSSWLDWVSTHRGRILEILEVRLGCEMFAARLAAHRAGPTELAQLVEALRVMKLVSETRDVPSFVQSDLAFHGAILRASGNKTLQELVGALGRNLIPERAAIADIPGRTARSFAEHYAIYDAVQTGNADVAAAAMQNHLESVRHDVLVHLLGDAEYAVAAETAGGAKPANGPSNPMEQT